MDSVSFFWSFFKMLAALAVVIAMMIGAMYLIKKYFYQSPATAGGSAMIHVISSCYLGPKSSILLVEVLGQAMLLGVTDHQMSILATITDQEAVEKLKGIRLNERLLPVSDPFSRYKSLLQNFSRMRKDR
ncbi:MAG: flagellar biosynthetic protein FliO [Deltaproteobacteria bacterium]|nr:flagellar biosynthetic protein FliO [Deltaproteobacteria bacterium]